MSALSSSPNFRSIFYERCAQMSSLQPLLKRREPSCAAEFSLASSHPRIRNGALIPRMNDRGFPAIGSVNPCHLDCFADILKEDLLSALTQGGNDARFVNRYTLSPGGVGVAPHSRPLRLVYSHPQCGSGEASRAGLRRRD